MSRGPGRPENGRLLKSFYMDPELELRMTRALTPQGHPKPPHGAVSDLLNALIRNWLDSKEK